MNYGPHSQLVEEVIASIARGAVFRPTAPVDAPDALVITDLKQAQKFAWSLQVAGDESPTFTDVREDEIAPMYALPYEQPDLKLAYDAVEALMDPIDKMLEEKLPTLYVHMVEQIGGDLLYCALHRALYGLVEGSFWERLWRVYRQGAWPCGWEGDYPAGRMIIYQPPIISV